MRAIALFLPSLGGYSCFLRPLDGHGELAVAAGDPQAAQRLLAGLLRTGDGAAVELGDLLACWRDRLLAEIYREAIGERVECRSTCIECSEAYEFAFALKDIIAAQDATARASGLEPDDEGLWAMAGGVRLRPPSLADLAQNQSTEALRRRLVQYGDLADTVIDAALEAGAPLLSFDCDAQCPHCEAPQQVAFDIGPFLTRSLAAERPFLIRETHLIASRYGWDHATIMALPRRDRQAYAGLIESERSAQLARRA
jgi:hypothetical protein